jgi:hypothetical protein
MSFFACCRSNHTAILYFHLLARAILFEGLNHDGSHYVAIIYEAPKFPTRGPQMSEQDKETLTIEEQEQLKAAWNDAVTKTPGPAAASINRGP